MPSVLQTLQRHSAIGQRGPAAFIFGILLGICLYLNVMDPNIQIFTICSRQISPGGLSALVNPIGNVGDFTLQAVSLEHFEYPDYLRAVLDVPLGKD